MANTTYSEQAIWNKLHGTSDSKHSPQTIANLHKGSVNSTLQNVLNTALGKGPTEWSVQRCLYNILATKLSLTGGYTAYSEQALLNMAYTQGGITADQVLGLAA